MVENKEKVENVENFNGVNPETVATPKKHRGRGISNDTRATARRKFNEQEDANQSNGLFIGHLDNVEVTWSTLKEDANIPSFAGHSIPYLVFTFASNKEKNINERKYVTMRIGPAESNVETIPGGKNEWKVTTIFNQLKHIYDVFVLRGTRMMTEAEEDALSLDFEDFEDDGQGGYIYVPVEPEVVINGYKNLFENFVKLLNNNGKPYYKTEKGGILPVWMKLLRFIKIKTEWKPVVNGNSTFGDLGFPAFIGEGVLELYSDKKQPILKVDFNKETIVYQKSAEKAKTPNIGAPGAPMAMPGGMPTTPATMPNGPTFDGGQSNAFGGGFVDTAAETGASGLPF